MKIRMGASVKMLSWILICFGMALPTFAETNKVDPNLAKSQNKGQALAPGCSQFVHPCNGQATTVPLAAKTVDTTTAITKPAASKNATGQK